MKKRVFNQSVFKRFDFRQIIAMLVAFCLVYTVDAKGQSCAVDEKEILGKLGGFEYLDCSGQIFGFDAFTFKGEWSSLHNYKKNSIVLRNGVFWVAKEDTINKTPVHKSDFWSTLDGVKYLKKEEEIVWYTSFQPQESVAQTGSKWTRSSNYTRFSEYRDDDNVNENRSIKASCSGGGWDDFVFLYGEDAYLSDPYHWTYTEDCKYYYEDEDPSEAVDILESMVRIRVVELEENQVYFDESENVSSNRFYSEIEGFYHEVDGDYDLQVFESITENHSLSESQTGSDKIAEAIDNSDDDDWQKSYDSIAWMGFWSSNFENFDFESRIIRFSAIFDCIQENAKLEVTYRVWPIAGDEKTDGVDEKETVTVTKSMIEEVEGGKEVSELYIKPKDGFYKRVLKVRLMTPCDEGGDNNGGNSNGAGPGSMWWWVSLGKGLDGAGIGNLRVEESEMGTKSATPMRLKYDGGMNANVKVIKDDLGGVRQILAPEVFADVVVLDDYSYEIRFYDSTDAELEYETLSVGPVGDPVETEVPTGLYKASGLPFSVWKVENPAGAISTNRVKISHLLGEASEVYEFEENGGTWSLESGEGLQRQELTKTTLLNGDLETIKVIKDGSGTVSSKIRTVEHYFSFGRQIVEQVNDPDGDAFTTTWEYYDNPLADGGAYAQLKKVIYPDSSWERYEYDTEGRESKVVRPWLDGSANSADSASQVTLTSYAIVSGEQTTTIIEKIMDEEVARRYWVKSSDGSQIQQIICTVPGAARDAGSNLVTTTHYLTEGDFKGYETKIVSPDGTLTRYSYSKNGGTGEVTTTAQSGEPNGGGTTIVSGRETTTIEDAKRRLVSRVEKDIASGVVLEGVEVMNRDEFGRETELGYSDGTTEEKVYTCCGVERITDRNGTTTHYTYDALKRVLSETRDGITLLYGYDASGRVLKKTRCGGSSGGDIDIETLTYDLAGRVTSRTDAIDQTTSFEEEINGSGQTVRTTTLPDSSTRVEISHRDGQMKEINGTAARPVRYEYGVSSGLQFTKEIRIGEGGAETEWIKTWSDPAGRIVKVEYPGGAEETYHYNALGQQIKRVNADGGAQLFAYNALGEQEEEALDANGNDAIDAADRRTKTVSSVVAGPLVRTVTQQGNTTGYTTVSTVDASPNGRYRKETRHGLETVMTTTFGSSGASTEVTTYPDGSTLTVESENGRQVATARKASGGAAMASATYDYDPHGRLLKKTDGRVGTETSYTYNNADQVTQIDVGGMVTTYAYNSLGQVTTETLPGSGRTLTRSYLPTGEITEEGGSATYPVTYTYDPQGRRRTMVTSSGTTKWTYDGARGWLTSKADAANEAVAYTYTPGGKLATRTWARGIVTTYGYNGAGELNSTTYSDGTPPIAITYDERGRPEEVTDASGTRTLSYTSAGQLEVEAISGGLLDGVEVETGYDALLRRNSLSASRASAALVNTAYTYDGASRLATVTSGSNSTVYNYIAGSSLVGEITFKQSGNTAMTTAKTYDGLNRLTSISSAPSVGGTASYAYQYNSAGQRGQITQSGGDTWNYGYNSRGEVTSGGKKQGGSTDLLGYQFGYAYDNIGNRTSSTKSSRTTSYVANNLNQYTGRTVPGYLDVIGEAKPAATVTVNGTSAMRQGSAYYKELSADNSEGPVYLTATVKAELDEDEAERSGKLYLASNEEAYTYDKDGNLLSDGRWSYHWNGENRLVKMETQPTAVATGVPRQRLTFAYDYQGRRISKKLENWKSGWYQERYTLLFIYDGWNLMAEVLQTGPKIRSYVWGSDLSGGNSAGGVGGLLFIGQYPENKHYATGYDGNGNVTGLFEVESDGEQKARYEYGPFGEPLMVSGAYAEINPIRWSTKYVDGDTELAYYGYRYYAPKVGRWVNRDPVEERGGKNLFGFVRNNALNRIDFLGLAAGSIYKTLVEAVKASGMEIYNKPDINEREYGAPLFEHYSGPSPFIGKVIGYSYGSLRQGNKVTMNQRLLGMREGVDPGIGPAPKGACFIGNIHSHPSVAEGVNKDAEDYADGKGGVPPFSGSYEGGRLGDLDRYDELQNNFGLRYQLYWFLVLSPGGQVWSYTSPIRGRDNKPNVDWATIRLENKRFKKCCTLEKSEK